MNNVTKHRYSWFHFPLLCFIHWGYISFDKSRLHALNSVEIFNCHARSNNGNLVSAIHISTPGIFPRLKCSHRWFYYLRGFICHQFCYVRGTTKNFHLEKTVSVDELHFPNATEFFFFISLIFLGLIIIFWYSDNSNNHREKNIFCTVNLYILLISLYFIKVMTPTVLSCLLPNWKFCQPAHPPFRNVNPGNLRQLFRINAGYFALTPQFCKAVMENVPNNFGAAYMLLFNESYLAENV